MNITSSPPASGEALKGAQSAWTLAAGGGAAPLTPSGAGDSAAPLDSGEVTAFFQSGSPASYTGLQTAASYAQTASGYVGQIGELLQQMGDLSSRAQNGTQEARAGATAVFEAAQKGLRAIVGGTPGEIGGSPSQGAVFGGSELFGPSAGSTTVATGLSQEQSITLGGSDLNLRQGAVLSLIRQDPSGAFVLGAADPGASQAVSGAEQQVDSACRAVNRTQAMVDVAAAQVQVGEENLASAVFAPSDAAAASTYAANAILGLRGAAVAAYTGMASQPSVGLLQAV
jgi:flagellin-like hook-associated protein FlgL